MAAQLCLAGAMLASQPFLMKDGKLVLPPPRPRLPSNISLARVARGRKLEDTPARQSCGRCCYTVINDIAGTGLDASFYAKRVDLRGFTVAGSASVRDDALLEAALTVDRMVSKRPDLLQTLINEGVHLTVLGKDDMTTDVPEYGYLASDTGFNWDTTRGLGATVGAPVSSCAEENLLCYGPAQDVYDGENICVHETAHSLQGSGCKLPTRRYNAQGSGLNAAIDTAYEAAKSNGRWSNTYAISTHEEFWAEGVQAFYNVDQSGPIGGDGVHNHVDTRAELEAYEPDLANLIAQMFDAAQSFPCPTASCDCSTFVCPVSQAPPQWRCDAPVDTLQEWSCATAGNRTASCCGPAPLPAACPSPASPSTPQTSPSSPSPSLSPPPPPCTDENSDCEYWASIGECEVNPHYMLSHCMVSCATCPSPNPNPNPNQLISDGLSPSSSRCRSASLRSSPRRATCTPAASNRLSWPSRCSLAPWCRGPRPSSFQIGTTWTWRRTARTGG